MAKEEIDKIYRSRIGKAKERLRFGLRPKSLTTIRDSCIVKLNDFFGVKYREQLSLLPVFDEIRLSDDGALAFCRIKNLWAVFSSPSGKRVIESSLCEIPIYHSSYHTLEIIAENRLRGLYDTLNLQLLLRADYDEVGHCAQFNYIWIRKGKAWGFVNKSTHKEILIDKMDMAYKADGGLFLRSNDEIICLNTSGVNDSMALRHYVANHHGRGKVYNENYHETVIFDIYGHIL